MKISYTIQSHRQSIRPSIRGLWTIDKTNVYIGFFADFWQIKGFDYLLVSNKSTNSRSGEGGGKDIAGVNNAGANRTTNLEQMYADI